jgi:hypothetical protein
LTLTLRNSTNVSTALRVFAGFLTPQTFRCFAYFDFDTSLLHGSQLALGVLALAALVVLSIAPTASSDKNRRLAMRLSFSADRVFSLVNN